MTSKDTNINDSTAMQDTEFEEFLQGQGALADLLQELPQDAPSATLDAAILADAEAALAPPMRLAAAEAPMIQPAGQAPQLSQQPPLSQQPQQAPLPSTAANDGQNPDASSQRPAFLSRWKLPLGLAASVLLAVPLVIMQKHPKDAYPQLAKNELPLHMPEERKAVAAAPAADMDSVAANIPAQSPRKPTSSAKTGPRLADKDSTNTGTSTIVAMNRPEVVAPVPAAAAAAPAAAVTAAPVATEQVIVAAAPPATVIAAAPPASLAAVSTTAPTTAPTTASTTLSAADISAMAKMAANAASDDKQATGGRAADRARAFATGSVAMKEEAPLQYARANAAEARPAAPPASMDMRMAKSAAPVNVPPLAAIKPSLEAHLTENSRIGIPLPVAAAPPLIQAPPAAIMVPDAQWRLAKIDKLIKAKQNKEALEEWNRFRIAYPDYVVDKSLQKQIENLQK
ncbi:hypothetical protein ACO0LM_13270 [Undibacterium sp. Di26W]|uniref:hypothetical protein n=1 Tax=Undibacterium sp. Di26W TaxID=3413035 RepID=UPI003BF3F777